MASARARHPARRLPRRRKRNRRARRARRAVRPRNRTGRDRHAQRRRRLVTPIRSAGRAPRPLRLRARLLRKPVKQRLRAERPDHPRIAGRNARPRSARASRSGCAHARLRPKRSRRIRTRKRPPIPRRNRPKPLRRQNIHQTNPGRTKLRSPAQTQRHPRHRQRQTTHRRRRFDRPRHNNPPQIQQIRDAGARNPPPNQLPAIRHPATSASTSRPATSSSPTAEPSNKSGNTSTSILCTSSRSKACSTA